MADRLTDEQLREELLSLGETKVGPITVSTRAIYIKKLNHLRARKNIANRSKGSRSTGKKLLGFSSDESDNEDAGPGARQKGRPAPRRRGSGRPSLPQPSVKSVANNSLTRPSLRRRSYHNPEEASTSAAAIQTNFHADFDHGDEHYDDSENLDLQDNSLPSFDQFESSDSDEGQFNLNSSGDTTGHAGPEMASVSVNTSDRLDDSRYWGAPASSPLSVSSYSPRNSRLNAVYGKPNSPTWSQNRSLSKANSPKLNKKGESEEEIRKYGFKTRDDPHSYRISQYISMFLLVLAGLFFLVLGFMYINVRGFSAFQKAEPERTNWLVCPIGNIGKLDQGACYSSDKIKQAAEIASDLIDIASQRAGDVNCGFVEGNGTLTWTECRQKLEELGHNAETLMDFKLPVFALCAANEHWMIRLYDEAGEHVTGEGLEKVVKLKSFQAIMPLLCRLQRAFYGVVNIFIALVITAIILSLLIIYVKYRIKRKEAETQLVYHLVDEIINILREHHDSCQTNKDLQPYLPLPHVRDMLIPPKERAKKSDLWNQAVKFLSANESRVRVEIQKIHGEEFTVWRWLQVGNTQATPNGGRVWQGQAFGENKEGSAFNMPAYSPTQCLKIRNMFDSEIEYGENWHIYIQDAILEKCGLLHGILHIAVDKTSTEGCVYAKCTTPEKAGAAYRALHGWWFDGNLVTVKYLRLERYHERFPDSRSCIAPLLPSNNQRLSLSQPFHKSIIETS